MDRLVSPVGGSGRMTGARECSCSQAPRAPPTRLQGQRVHHRHTRPMPACQAADGGAGEALQNIIVGGSVVGAVGAALYSALRKEQVLCDTCQGTGGIKCFACAGEGRMENLISRDDLYRQDMARNPLGRSRNPRECRACGGVGMILCSKCNGSGYRSTIELGTAKAQETEKVMEKSNTE